MIKAEQFYEQFFSIDLPFEHQREVWDHIRNIDLPLLLKAPTGFVNETLDYQANDYEARDTLIDLYECVLYADERPTNIQLRDGKPITLVVVDLSKGEGRKKEDRIRDAIRKLNIRDNSISVDFGVGWKLLKKGILKYGLDFNEEKGEWDFKEESRDFEEILTCYTFIFICNESRRRNCESY